MTVETFKKFYDTTDDDAAINETVERFLLADPGTRQQFVQGLETSMLEDEIGLSERAQRHALHRQFRGIHDGLKRLGR